MHISQLKGIGSFDIALVISALNKLGNFVPRSTKAPNVNHLVQKGTSMYVRSIPRRTAFLACGTLNRIPSVTQVSLFTSSGGAVHFTSLFTIRRFLLCYPVFVTLRLQSHRILWP